MTRAKRNAIWRSTVTDIDYVSCQNLDIKGMLMPTNDVSRINLRDDIFSYGYVDNAKYMPGCYAGKPVYSANKQLGFETLPIVQLDWNTFINHRNEGEFMYSIYPTIYSVTAATVVSCFLTVIVFTNTQKPSIFLILGPLLSSINLINILSSTMKLLSDNILLGKASGENLIDNITSNVSFNVIDLFSVFILQLCQVQIIMRLFSRQKEKRFTFAMGVTLSVISQAIWAVSTFHSMKYTEPEDYDPDDDALSIMPAFIYLLRIAMSVMYSVLICIYCFIKLEFLKNKNLILISLVSILSTNLQFAFFIADVANVWVAELSEVFNAAGYVVSTVIVWEWINRIHACERAKQDKGILGRPFYEEELGGSNKVDRVSLFVPEHEQKLLYYGNSGSFDGNHSFDQNEGDGFGGKNDFAVGGKNGGAHNVSGPENGMSPRSAASKKIINLNTKIYDFVSTQQVKTKEFVSTTIPDMVKKTADMLLYITDQIIAYGLAVPRSVSVNSKERKDRKKLVKKMTSKKYKSHKPLDDSSSNDSALLFHNSNESRSENGETASETVERSQRPIFIYNTTKVKINEEDLRDGSMELMGQDNLERQIHRHMEELDEAQQQDEREVYDDYEIYYRNDDYAEGEYINEGNYIIDENEAHLQTNHRR